MSSPNPAMTAEEWIDSFKLESEALDNSFIYYPMKLYNLTRISVQSVELVKTCYMLEKKGLLITTPLLVAITKKEYQNLLSQMHTLGDKRVVLLRGTDGPKLVWTIHPDFLAVLEPTKETTK